MIVQSTTCIADTGNEEEILGETLQARPLERGIMELDIP